jgi:hypothetical protein
MAAEKGQTGCLDGRKWRLTADDAENKNPVKRFFHFFYLSFNGQK